MFIMRCPECNYENEKGTKYCTECGTPLFKKCDKCGKSTQLYAKFCPECGSQFHAVDFKIERYKRHLHFYDNITISKSKYGKYIIAKENKELLILSIRTLKKISERRYDDINNYLLEDNSFIMAKHKDKWGIIDPLKDDVIINFNYDDVKDDHCNGTIRLKLDNKWGRLEVETGKVVLPFLYDEIEYDSRVKRCGYWGAISNKGDQIVPCEYLELSPYSPCENIRPSQYKNGKWGVINILNGKTILEFDYDEIQYCEPFGISVYYFRKGDKWGMYSQRGKKYPCVYSKEYVHHLEW